MTLALVMPAAEAALFTAGCAAIHGLRRQADAVTLALGGILTILVLLVGIACTPETYRTAQADGFVAEIGPMQP